MEEGEKKKKGMAGVLEEGVACQEFVMEGIAEKGVMVVEAGKGGVGETMQVASLYELGSAVQSLDLLRGQQQCKLRGATPSLKHDEALHGHDKGVSVPISISNVLIVLDSDWLHVEHVCSIQLGSFKLGQTVN